MVSGPMFALKIAEKCLTVNQRMPDEVVREDSRNDWLSGYKQAIYDVFIAILEADAECNDDGGEDD